MSVLVFVKSNDESRKAVAPIYNANSFPTLEETLTSLGTAFFHDMKAVGYLEQEDEEENELGLCCEDSIQLKHRFCSSCGNQLVNAPREEIGEDVYFYLDEAMAGEYNWRSPTQGGLWPIFRLASWYSCTRS